MGAEILNKYVQDKMTFYFSSKFSVFENSTNWSVFWKLR